MHDAVHPSRGFHVWLNQMGRRPQDLRKELVERGIKLLLCNVSDQAKTMLATAKFFEQVRSPAPLLVGVHLVLYDWLLVTARGRTGTQGLRTACANSLMVVGLVGCARWVL